MNEILKHYEAIPLGGKRNIHKELHENFSRNFVTPLGKEESCFYNFPKEDGEVISNPDAEKNLPIGIIESKEENLRAFIEINLKYVLKETKLKD